MPDVVDQINSLWIIFMHQGLQLAVANYAEHCPTFKVCVHDELFIILWLVYLLVVNSAKFK